MKSTRDARRGILILASSNLMPKGKLNVDSLVVEQDTHKASV